MSLERRNDCKEKLSTRKLNLIFFLIMSSALTKYKRNQFHQLKEESIKHG